MSGIDQSKIRNFCIIAHIDHGKSTLADRIIQKTGLLTEREMQDQVLDNMDLERERGITIKAQAVRTVYKAADGEEYILNMIDTPGHVDFNYEVSRSLAACDGALLVVDASQGIEAQTLANVYLALDHDLDVFPVINKVDLPSAEPDRVIAEIEDVIGLEAQDAPRISAKTGLNVDEVLEQIVQKIPAPEGDPTEPLKALIFDSVYDAYRGVIISCRVMEGSVKKGTRIRMMATGAVEEVVEVGYFGAGRLIPCDELSAGMVGYITASIKNVKDTQVGDTVTDAANPAAEALPGYRPAQSMVYCGIYTEDGSKYPDLRLHKEDWRITGLDLKRHIVQGVPLGLQFSVLAIGIIVMQGGVVKFDMRDGVMVSNAAQNGFGAANRLFNLVATPMNALGGAMTSFTAQNLGAGQYDRIRRGTLQALGMVSILAILAAGTGLLLTRGDFCYHVFLSADKVTPDAVRYGNSLLYVDFSMYLFLGFVFVVRNCVQGIGRSGFVLGAGAAELVARITVCLVLPGLFAGGAVSADAPAMAFYALCAADPMAWIAADTVLCIPFFRNILKKNYGYLRSGRV